MASNIKAVIMAGGKGSRIAGVCSDRPKPMMDILGKPILERQVENLVASGITNITIVTGHLGRIIKDYFGGGDKWNANISYYEEDAEHPLGTAGALFCMQKSGAISEDFLLMNGDLVFDIDFRRLIDFHKTLAAKYSPLATILVHPNSHPYDSALIEIERRVEYGGIPYDTGCVTQWLGRKRDGTDGKKDAKIKYHRNIVNAGIQIITQELLNLTRQRLPAAFSAPSPAPLDTPPCNFARPCSRKETRGAPLDLDKDVLRPAIGTKRIFAMRTTEYICDMGTPERYSKVVADVAAGRVSKRNLIHKQRAVFLDRDDTINYDVHFMKRAEQLALLPGAAKAVRLINEAGYLAVVITNQPVIARGEATWEDLDEIHAKLETLLGAEGAYLDGIYVCPHHPDKGFAGERAEYKVVCNCRKPKTGLIEAAARDMNIDISQSIMIGDRAKDEECGRNAGCLKSIKLHTGYTLLDAVEAAAIAASDGRR